MRSRIRKFNWSKYRVRPSYLLIYLHACVILSFVLQTFRLTVLYIRLQIWSVYTHRTCNIDNGLFMYSSANFSFVFFFLLGTSCRLLENFFFTSLVGRCFLSQKSHVKECFGWYLWLSWAMQAWFGWVASRGPLLIFGVQEIEWWHRIKRAQTRMH